MMKNVAYSLKTLRSGDEEARKAMGVKKMSAKELAQRNTDELAHENYVTNHKYRDDRAQNYPSIPDQLDAIWKTLDFLLDGKQYPAQVIALREQVRVVKKQFPKPEKG